MKCTAAWAKGGLCTAVQPDYFHNRLPNVLMTYGVPSHEARPK